MVNLKESTQKNILNFITKEGESNIIGLRLLALYKLIQKVGEPIKTNDENMKGLMCLQFIEGQYIAIKKTSFKMGSFFPCKIVTYHLKSVD